MFAGLSVETAQRQQFRLARRQPQQSPPVKDRSRQRPGPGPRFSGNVAQSQRTPGRFRGASLFTLLLLIVAVGMNDVAQASVRAGSEELALLEFASVVAAAPQAGVTAEPAQWRAVLHDAPSCEFPALEPETNGDPAGPDAACVLGLGFGSTATVTATGQLLQAAPVTHMARFATSPVLARAPPHDAR